MFGELPLNGNHLQVARAKRFCQSVCNDIGLYSIFHLYSQVLKNIRGENMGKGKGGGKGGGWPSKHPGKPSGSDRDNNPPKEK
jgi:hypothetical protein